MLTTTTNVLKALAIFAAKGDTRFYLNGVCVEAKAGDSHAVMVATDGHRLLAVHAPLDAPMEEDFKRIIPGDAIRGLKSGEVSITFAGQSVSLTSSAGTITVSAMDGKYPDWRRFVPKAYSGKPAAYTPDYLADAKKARDLLAGKKTAMLPIRMNGEGAAYLDMRVDNAVAVIMPVCGGLVPEVFLPDWVTE